MMSPLYRAGDSVRILDGANKDAIGVVDHSVASSGEWLYLVQRGEGASWVEEDRLAFEVPAGD